VRNPSPNIAFLIERVSEKAGRESVTGVHGSRLDGKPRGPRRPCPRISKADAIHGQAVFHPQRSNEGKSNTRLRWSGFQNLVSINPAGDSGRAA